MCRAGDSYELVDDSLELKAQLTELDRPKARPRESWKPRKMRAFQARTRSGASSPGRQPPGVLRRADGGATGGNLRALMADVKIRTHGLCGSRHRFLEPEWRPLVSLNSDGQHPTSCHPTRNPGAWCQAYDLCRETANWPAEPGPARSCGRRWRHAYRAFLWPASRRSP